MTIQVAAATRNTLAADIVTALGGNATLRFYSGSRPTPAAWSNGTASLAVLTFGSTAVTDAGGSVTGGVLTFGAYTQTSSSFTAGTPTWAALVTSGNICIVTVDIGAGTSNIQFSGSIVNGQSIAGPLVLTTPNA